VLSVWCVCAVLKTEIKSSQFKSSQVTSAVVVPESCVVVARLGRAGGAMLNTKQVRSDYLSRRAAGAARASLSPPGARS